MSKINDTDPIDPRIMGCSPTTLYAWMENNGLNRFIKSDKPLKAKKSTKTVDKVVKKG